MLGRLTRANGQDGSGARTPFDWLVVGLGNPGKEYHRTRHNVGQDTITRLAERHDVTLKGGRDHALVGEASFGFGSDQRRAVLAIPLTFMNESGRAVGALVRRYGIDASQVIVIHDELDLEPGIVRLKAGGGLAGHYGLRSISQHLKTDDYIRIRIGVGKPPHKDRGAKHVLGRIPASEREILDGAEIVAADAAEAIVSDGIDAAMAQFHSR